jgi:hypothetical protein
MFVTRDIVRQVKSMSSTTTFPITLPVDVLMYCESHQLTSHLESAIRIAEQAFAPVLGWQISLEADPEIDETYVVIDIAVSATVDEVLQRRREYTRRWVSTATPAATWRIRVLVDIQ